MTATEVAHIIGKTTLRFVQCIKSERECRTCSMSGVDLGFYEGEFTMRAKHARNLLSHTHICVAYAFFQSQNACSKPILPRLTVGSRPEIAQKLSEVS